MAIDSAIRDHQAWLGYLQPDGLVVSPAALVDAQVLLDRNTVPLQQRFLEYLHEVEHNEETTWAVRNLKSLLCGFLEWPDENLAGSSGQFPIPEELKVPLREFGETLEPSFAFRDSAAADEARTWMLLVKELPLGTGLDVAVESAMAGWSASHTRRFERLMREAQVPIGLISNGTHLRLVYAPRGENTGTLTFPIGAMVEVAGRPILAAFETLLSSYRLLAAPSEARLPALLKRSRDYQSRVSTALAGQVLDALYELLRGFQAANDRAHGELLQNTLARDPNEIYGGLLSVLMRLVFLLYAEDRGLMPGSDLYVRNYAVHGLFERLRADAEQYPDTMDHRYGAWAQLVALFRAVHEGCQHPLMSMPARLGHLFDPQRYLFLDGRSTDTPRLPLVSDGVIHRVLHKLLILDGERLSYRTLDVEQIGSVYETMMGFRLERTRGGTIALKPAKAHGAPVPINLDELLGTPARDRPKWVTEQTDCKLPDRVATEVRDAGTIDDLLAALERRIARNATPQPLPSGAMVLVPTDERRRSGSHYTPRTLTEPIVRTTLGPILKQLGVNPTPDQILNLKVADLACGSGAFLVEACRQLADALVAAWAFHGYRPHIPADEDEVLYARRLIAQRCLYGVDRNPMAVDLAKLSLWLATLAKDHPFTFLDHALRPGDSLVGLSREQITAFHWRLSPQQTFLQARLRDRLQAASDARRQILAAGDDMPPAAKAAKLAAADDALSLIRLAGDACVAAFFAGQRDRERNENRTRLLNLLDAWVQQADAGARAELGQAVNQLRSGDRPVTPFHWEIEFPEVFVGESPGFDAFIGNPPFAGKNTLINSNREGYLDWLKMIHEESHGNADIVAHFFRRAFNLLRRNGCFGLIATNTIGQGDTRSTGLRWICTHDGTIYSARKRYKWPGQAAVIVSVVHIHRGSWSARIMLDGKDVPIITAYLLGRGGHESPEPLHSCSGKSFQGSILLGMGFTFDDTDTSGIAGSLAERELLVAEHPHYRERILPYIGSDEVNNDPAQQHHRFAIDLNDLDETQARIQAPELLRIVEDRVKPERFRQNDEGGRRFWWRHLRPRPELYAAIAHLDHVLVIGCGATPHMSFALLPKSMIYANTLTVFTFGTTAAFCCCQSRIHEVWARREASSMKDDLRYTPTDCFETFPFPENYESDSDLELAGGEYYAFRATLMVRNSEGMTRTYNRFHNPAEADADIQRLRELHDAMDWAVLDAYGWTDIQPVCGFGLDYLDVEDEDMPADLDVPEQLWWPTAAEALAFAARLPQTRRRLPWRYRWPEDTRDEVLARLLELNKQRAEEERRTGAAAAAAAERPARSRSRSRRRNSAASGTPSLPFEAEPGSPTNT